MPDEIGIWSPYLDPARNDSVAVPASTTKISDARSLQSPRKLIVLRNISPNAADVITVNFGQIATANVGIILRQYDVYSEVADAGFTPYQGVINAICATANGVLAVEER